RRHPHVFDTSSHLASRPPNADLDSAGVLSQWENIKQQEKALAKHVQVSPEHLSMETTLDTATNVPDSVLDDITSGLTPLQRAVKLQKRAAKIGFDWPKPEPVFDKIHEELKELLQAVSTKDHSAIEDEIGDVLFTIVNLARKLKIHPTPALNRANKKFEERFRRIEGFMREDGHHGIQLELGLLDSYWEKAKSES
ncbi:MAG: MazG family protein, partial [Spirochaeta sp.]|nr:MazG family protein [Spirochaeta sp.]